MVPVPILRVGLGLDAVAAHVEPYRRVESCILAQKNVRELVVEDDLSLRHLALGILESQGYNVLRAPNGADELSCVSGWCDITLTLPNERKLST